MPLLTLKNISKIFVHRGSPIEVLREIQLTVNAGDSLAVMGVSGAGKSTLLNIMGSLEPPSDGIVLFNHMNLYQMDEIQLSRLRNQQIGFVFQFHHLLPELTALENTMMPALIARTSRNRAAGMAKDVLMKVGLKSRTGHRAGELSGGEQQRVAIARSLIMRPKLILGDEPTGNLDWLTGREIAELLLEFSRAEEIAMVIATHNRKLAEKMSRKMELIDGKIG